MTRPYRAKMLRCPGDDERLLAERVVVSEWCTGVLGGGCECRYGASATYQSPLVTADSCTSRRMRCVVQMGGGVDGWTRAGPSSFHRVSARRRPATGTTRWVCITGGSAARGRWGAAQETLLEGCGGPAGGALQKGRSRTISPCSCRPARILARPRACGIARQPYVLAAAARRAWVKVRIDSVTSPQVGPLRGG